MTAPILVEITDPTDKLMLFADTNMAPLEALFPFMIRDAVEFTVTAWDTWPGRANQTVEQFLDYVREQPDYINWLQFAAEVGGLLVAARANFLRPLGWEEYQELQKQQSAPTHRVVVDATTGTWTAYAGVKLLVAYPYQTEFEQRLRKRALFCTR